MDDATGLPAGPSETVWEVATLYPKQGDWSESDYLELTRRPGALAELTDGFVEVLPMPTLKHQLLVMFLAESLRAFVRQHNLGVAVAAPLRVKIAAGRFREPDVVFMRAEHRDRAGNDYVEGADLVMEVISDDEKGRQRDLVEKVADYAAAGISEYWVVDPCEQAVTIFSLAPGSSHYAASGPYGVGDAAASSMLAGFAVSVAELMQAADG